VWARRVGPGAERALVRATGGRHGLTTVTTAAASICAPTPAHASPSPSTSTSTLLAPYLYTVYTVLYSAAEISV